MGIFENCFLAVRRICERRKNTSFQVKVKGSLTSVKEGAEKCLFKPLFSAIAGISVAKIGQIEISTILFDAGGFVLESIIDYRIKFALP